MNSAYFRRLPYTTRIAMSGAAAGAAFLALSLSSQIGATAAPAKALSPKKPPGTLTFRVMARYASKDMRDGSVAAEQTLDAKVFSRGPRARVETTFADRPVVLLLAPPYVYRLLPNAHTGVRYRVDDEMTKSLSAANLASLLRDPSALRDALRRGGAKPSGLQTVNGQKLEVWTAPKFAGHPAQVKAWLRPSDALPVRLQVTSRTMLLSASWRDYNKGASLADSLFSVPAGFHVREAPDNAAPL